MGGPRPTQSAAGDGPGDGAAALILLAGPASQVERSMVTQWLDQGDLQPSAVFPLDSPGLARSLATTPPDTVVTAARVAWLPRERGGERRGPRPGGPAPVPPPPAPAALPAPHPPPQPPPAPGAGRPPSPPRAGARAE